MGGMVHRVRNVGLYLVGIGAAVAGALGMAAAIDLVLYGAVGLFVLGLAIVVAVHEYLDGPV